MSTIDTASDQDELQSLDIAIIGMAGRFPGAPDLDAFWRNLQDDVESITFFSDQQLIERGVDPALLDDPSFVKAEPVLDAIDQFSASFFGYSPKEAALLDPQQRIFLECAWEALERAGYSQDRAGTSVGVYAGMSLSTYLLFNLLATPELLASDDSLRVLIGNDKGFLSTRVGYHLDLRGPCIDVSTGCSTSLVAVHLACESLHSYQCDIALAGGISVNIPQRTGYRYQEGGVASPDGHCRAFDAAAQGSIFGSGVGIVVLKRLQEALDDGDTIQAVIKGSAVNNDGAAKVGYTAPSVDGQAEVLARAYAVARVSPDTVGYVEAHGSGTALGDPIEVAALTRAFSAHTDRSQFCALGSVKTNIGHLDAAAGIAGLIKTVLALKHGQLPPSLNFETPNPKIDFATSPFYVNTRLTPWPSGATPRRAGVSSFGVGGTNVHVVLEEAPPAPPAAPARPQQLLVLSAKTAPALEAATANLAAYLHEHPACDLADVTYTLAVGRRALPHRRVLVARQTEDALTALRSSAAPAYTTAIHDERSRAVVFMFPGLGDQYVEMAWGLYQSEPVFRTHIDQCSVLLLRYLGSDLRDVLYPQRGSGADPARTTGAPGAATLDLRAMLRARPDADPATARLNQTPLAHCALFVVEYALSQLWISWGVTPQALIGYSLGEYVAATLAGVMTLDEALFLISKRAQMIDALPPSAMLAVSTDAATLAPQLGRDLAIAAFNGPKLCVVAGTLPAIDELEQRLVQQGVVARRVQNSRALHSPQMTTITAELARIVRQIRLQPPRIRFVSNITGTWISDAAATDPQYWVDHLCRPVQFAAALEQLVRDPDWLLLEVGPGQALSSLATQHEARSSAQIVLPSLGYRYDRRPDRELVLLTLGALWQAGIAIDWAAFYGHEQRRRIPLPTYPFERERYWIAPQQPTVRALERPSASAAPLNLERWFYQPTWTSTALAPTDATLAAGCCLIFSDACGLSEALAGRLERLGWTVITVAAGRAFEQIAPSSFTLRPDAPDQYADLLAALDEQQQTPTLLVHAWALTGSVPADSQPLQTRLERTFYSLLYLAQALLRDEPAAPVKLVALSDGIHPITASEQLCPEKATLIGLCSVIPQEYQQVACQSIDVQLPERGGWQEQRLMDQLQAELLREPADPVVAYRGALRWVPGFAPLRLDDRPVAQTRLRPGGVYLITGGLGGIGLELARYLAETWQATLILTGRSPFPEQTAWPQWLQQHGPHDPTSQTIQRLQAIQALGATVQIQRADVTSVEEMQAVLAEIRTRYGALHGVIHAAGIAGSGLVRLKTADLAHEVLAPKIQGTLVLDALLADQPLDFMILCSSMSALFGGVGQADYSAANAFLDAFAQAATAQRNRPVTSINWYAWRDIGMEVKVELPFVLQQLRQEMLQHAISADEGVRAFQRIIGTPLPQVIVSSQPIDALREQSRQFTLARSLASLPTRGAAQTLHPRPSLRTAYVPPSTDLEQTLIGIWQDVLGIAEVGIHDNFFDLGGNSLTGLQVIAQLKRQLDIELAAVNLFEGPTVGALARVITQQGRENPAHQRSRRRGERRREKRQQPR